MKIEGDKLPTFVRGRGGWSSVIVWCQIIVSASSVHESTRTWRFTALPQPPPSHPRPSLFVTSTLPIPTHASVAIDCSVTVHLL